jgi:hypothetical protein
MKPVTDADFKPVTIDHLSKSWPGLFRNDFHSG